MLCFSFFQNQQALHPPRSLGMSHMKLAAFNRGTSNSSTDHQVKGLKPPVCSKGQSRRSKRPCKWDQNVKKQTLHLLSCGLARPAGGRAQFPRMYLEQRATPPKSHCGWPADLLTESRPGKEPQGHQLRSSQREVSRPLGSKRVTWELVKNANSQLHS